VLDAFGATTQPGQWERRFVHRLLDTSGRDGVAPRCLLIYPGMG